MIHSYKPTSQANAVNTIEKCIADVRNWMASNKNLGAWFDQHMKMSDHLGKI